mgnify:CR=1 FL=1
MAVVTHGGLVRVLHEGVRRGRAPSLLALERFRQIVEDGQEHLVSACGRTVGRGGRGLMSLIARWTAEWRVEGAGWSIGSADHDGGHAISVMTH